MDEEVVPEVTDETPEAEVEEDVEPIEEEADDTGEDEPVEVDWREVDCELVDDVVDFERSDTETATSATTITTIIIATEATLEIDCSFFRRDMPVLSKRENCVLFMAMDPLRKDNGCKKIEK